MGKSRQEPSGRSPLKRWQWIGLVVAIVLFIVPLALQYLGAPLPGLSEAGHRVFSIFLLAIVLWVCEAVPLHATAAIIILLEVLFISDASLLPIPKGFEAKPYASIFATLAHPILMLFLGGFFLADGAAKFELDRNLTRVLLKPFGTSPRKITLGLMLITAVFSMFMSNTATTATMMMVVLPVIGGLPAGDRMRVALALCIPVAANVGGIGTPIGTPPNAIALGALIKEGISIGFLQWMTMTVPFMVVILLFAWGLLNLLYRSSQKTIELRIDSKFDTSRSAKIFYVTAAATIPALVDREAARNEFQRCGLYAGGRSAVHPGLQRQGLAVDPMARIVVGGRRHRPGHRRRSVGAGHLAGRAGFVGARTFGDADRPVGPGCVGVGDVHLPQCHRQLVGAHRDQLGYVTGRVA